MRAICPGEQYSRQSFLLGMRRDAASRARERRRVGLCRLEERIVKGKRLRGNLSPVRERRQWNDEVPRLARHLLEQIRERGRVVGREEMTSINREVAVFDDVAQQDRAASADRFENRIRHAFVHRTVDVHSTPREQRPHFGSRQPSGEEDIIVRLFQQALIVAAAIVAAGASIMVCGSISTIIACTPLAVLPPSGPK